MCRLGRSQLWGPRGLRVPRLGVRRWEGRWQGWSPGPRLASLAQWHGSEHALAVGGQVSFVSSCHWDATCMLSAVKVKT